MLTRLVHGWRAPSIRSAWPRGPLTTQPEALSTASDSAANGSQWNDFNNVVKELRRIAQAEGLGGTLPDTKLLKDLGHKDLVLAIRKKHGGFVAIAAKLGVRVDKEDVAIQKKITSRANRRKKREMRVAKHDFY